MGCRGPRRCWARRSTVRDSEEVRSARGKTEQSGFGVRTRVLGWRGLRLCLLLGALDDGLGCSCHKLRKVGWGAGLRRRRPFMLRGPLKTLLVTRTFKPLLDAVATCRLRLIASQLLRRLAVEFSARWPRHPQPWRVLNLLAHTRKRRGRAESSAGCRQG